MYRNRADNSADKCLRISPPYPSFYMRIHVCWGYIIEGKNGRSVSKGHLYLGAVFPLVQGSPIPNHGLVLVCSLLGTGLCMRRVHAKLFPLLPHPQPVCGAGKFGEYCSKVLEILPPSSVPLRSVIVSWLTQTLYGVSSLNKLFCSSKKSLLSFLICRSWSLLALVCGLPKLPFGGCELYDCVCSGPLEVTWR